MDNFLIKYELLKEYYNEHGTINDIYQKYEVEVDGVVHKLGSFLSDQRKLYKKYQKLLKNNGRVDKKVLKHFELLEELKIDWNPKETEWLKKYNLLLVYKNEFGNIDVNYNYEVEVDKEVIPLGVFLANQRALYRKYLLKDKKDEDLERHFQMLEELGIDWNPQENDWKKKFAACKDYYEKNGNLNIGEDFIYNYDGEDVNIGVFLTNQRAIYRKFQANKLKREDYDNLLEHFKLLESIGVVWYIQKAKLEFMQGLLKEYRDTYGNLDIPVDYVIEVDGDNIALGMYLSDQRELRRKYFAEERKEQDEDMLERFKFLDSLGIDWEPNENYWLLHYNMCVLYKKEYGDLLVGGEYETEYEGKTIYLGKFLVKQRELYRKHAKDNFKNCDENTLKHFRMLTDLGISWYPSKDEWKRQYEILCKCYEKMGTIDVASDFTMIIDDEVVNVGVIAANQKEAMAKRKKEIIEGSASAEVMLRYHLLCQIGYKFPKEYNSIVYNDGTGERKYTQKELCEHLDFPLSTFRKYLKRFDGDVNKTINICSMNKKLKNNKNEKKGYSLNNLLEEFDIDLDSMERHLDKTRTKVSERKNKVMMYGGKESLRKYCIDRGYNYGVILYTLRLKEKELVDEDFYSILNRVLASYVATGQQKAPSWIYGKYGNEVVVKHLLTALEVDHSAVLRDMGNNCITMEEALENNCFKRVNATRNYDYLEGLYHDIVSKFKEINEDSLLDQDTAVVAIVSYVKDKCDEFRLNTDEYFAVINSFFKYTKVINKYHIFDVGLEKDHKKKIEKIMNYVLDDKEIRESFFAPLKIHDQKLVTSLSDEKKRSDVLREAILHFPEFSMEEKEKFIKQYKINLREVEYIEKTIEEMDSLIKEVRRKKKFSF